LNGWRTDTGPGRHKQEVKTMDTDRDEPVLSVRGLQKSFGPLQVLQGIDLALRPGDVLALIGPSGSGKSTLIRCMNMLEVPSAGEVLFHGRKACASFKGRGALIGTGELRRRVGMVFQHFHLFPHRTVLQNVTQGPIVVLGEAPAQAENRARTLLDRVGLLDKCDAYPNHLSGGQKQRVAIARALAMNPEVLLLDEITSALDPELVGEVLAVIRDLASQGMTMILVTHEMGFAADVASRVVFMEAGRIVESGPPGEVLARPRTERLQAFLARHLR
jgi:ABC-type polar amino acid transport system ATPase subunit